MVALHQEHSRQDNGREKEKNYIFRPRATSLEDFDLLQIFTCFDINCINEEMKVLDSSFRRGRGQDHMLPQ